MGIPERCVSWLRCSSVVDEVTPRLNMRVSVADNLDVVDHAVAGAKHLTLYQAIGFTVVAMKIGETAVQAGVNVQTLRFYEKRGLLRPPSRSASGYRSYGKESVQVVRFIKHAQELGFTLADVESLLRLAAGGRGNCRAVRNLAANKLSDLDRKITMLQSMRTSLQRLVETCDRPRGRRECPLLDALEEAAT